MTIEFMPILSIKSEYQKSKYSCWVLNCFLNIPDNKLVVPEE